MNVQDENVPPATHSRPSFCAVVGSHRPVVNEPGHENKVMARRSDLVRTQTAPMARAPFDIYCDDNNQPRHACSSATSSTRTMTKSQTMPSALHSMGASNVHENVDDVLVFDDITQSVPVSHGGIMAKRLPLVDLPFDNLSCRSEDTELSTSILSSSTLQDSQDSPMAMDPMDLSCSQEMEHETLSTLSDEETRLEEQSFDDEEEVIDVEKEEDDLEEMLEAQDELSDVLDFDEYKEEIVRHLKSCQVITNSVMDLNSIIS